MHSVLSEVICFFLLQRHATLFLERCEQMFTHPRQEADQSMNTAEVQLAKPMSVTVPAYQSRID